jgi:hypothetical protein
VREGDGDLAEAHVGEHRAQHVSQGQRRDPAQLRPEKKVAGELVNREAANRKPVARVGSPVQGRSWALDGAPSPTW